MDNIFSNTKQHKARTVDFTTSDHLGQLKLKITAQNMVHFKRKLKKKNGWKQ